METNQFKKSKQSIKKRRKEMETTNKSLVDNLSFLSKALVKKGDNRFHVTHIKVSDGTGHATDGRRAHIVNEMGIEDGFYKIVKTTKTKAEYYKIYEDHDYPNLNMIFDKKKTCHFIHESGLGGEFIPTLYATIIRNMPEEMLLDYDYLRDACSTMNDIKLLIPASSNEWSPLFIENGTKQAVIMPLKK